MSQQIERRENNMARRKGTFHVSANYEPLKAAPFDAR
jgi:hypothetical protein